MIPMTRILSPEPQREPPIGFRLMITGAIILLCLAIAIVAGGFTFRFLSNLFYIGWDLAGKFTP